MSIRIRVNQTVHFFMSGVYALVFMLALANLISCKRSPETAREPVTSYYMAIDTIGTEYLYFINVSTFEANGALSCGEVTGPDRASLISGYDSTLIQFTDRTVIPKRSGITSMVIGANQGPGTVPDRMTIEITEREGELALNIW